MAVDIGKLSRGEQIIGVSGIALFIFSFFKWYKLDTGGQEVPEGLSVPGISGFDTTLGMLAAIIALVMVAQIAATKLGGVKMPDLGSVTWGQVHLGLGALALLCVVIRLIDTPGIGGFNRTIWLIISAIAAVGLAGGGYLKFQEEKSGSGGMPPRPPGA